MTSASQPGHSLSFTYDPLGRKLTETGPDGTVRSYWDKAGRRTQLNYPDGFSLGYTYHDTGEMKEILQQGTFSSTFLIGFGYDNLGRRTSISRANGATTSYAYDPVWRLSQLVQDPAGTTHDLTLGFSYNPASQITSNTRSNDLYAWTGHGSGTTSSPANGLNQLVSHGGAAVAHDVKGNVTSDPTIGYSYGYSSENLLTSVQIGSNTGTLRYDPLMRLYEAGISGKARFVYDGESRIEEYSSSGAQMYRFVHGPGIDEPLIEYDLGANTRRFLHADERGSIIALSRTDGVVTNVNRYDEYGKPADTNRGRFLFTGYPVETLTELYYARARLYNYRIGGRFMQPDPIGYADGPNLYIYVNGDSINLYDPTGMCGQRYEDGRCKVSVDEATGDAGKKAAKELEGRLNAHDKTINGLANGKSYPVANVKGEEIGSMTGKEIKSIWNGTSWSITSTDWESKNGGLGAASGNWSGDVFSGAVELMPKAVDRWGSLFSTGDRHVKVDTLIFHELGHLTRFGQEFVRAYPVTNGTYDLRAERAASSAGQGMARAINGRFYCAVARGGCVK